LEKIHWLLSQQQIEEKERAMKSLKVRQRNMTDGKERGEARGKTLLLCRWEIEKEKKDHSLIFSTALAYLGFGRDGRKWSEERLN